VLVGSPKKKADDAKPAEAAPAASETGATANDAAPATSEPAAS